MMEGNRGNVDLIRLLGKLIYATSSLFKFDIEFRSELFAAQSVEICEEETIAVSLILSELLINAVKHHGKNKLGEDKVIVVMKEGGQFDFSVYLKNSIADIVQAETKEGTHVGQSMIEALMPPKGARLMTECNDNFYAARLMLGSPVVKVSRNMVVADSNMLAS